jgi:tetratricopeptide (TPR) repeat protein
MTQPLEQAQQECFRYQGLGNYHKKQENYKQALQEYANALYEFWRVCALMDNMSKRGNDKPYHELEDKIQVTFGLAGLIQEITSCYFLQNDYKKAKFFDTQLKYLIEILGEEKKYFNTAMQEVYEKLSERAEFAEMTGKLAEIASEFSDQYKSIEESEEIFNKLVSDFKRICSSEICLMSSRGVSVTRRANVTREDKATSSSCFIATAAYTTAIHPDLDTFRDFRDSQLLTNIVGRLLVRLYYKISPILADYITRKPAFRKVLRCQLERLAQWMRNQ